MIGPAPESPDATLERQVVMVLIDVARLVPHLSRLKAIAENPDHPFFVDTDPQSSPELKEHVSIMRRAHLGALVHMVSVVMKTHLKARQSLPTIAAETKKRIVDESMRHLGIDDKGQGVS